MNWPSHIYHLSPFSAHGYESYLLNYQSEEPLIHMLHSGMSSPLTDLMQNFVNKNHCLMLLMLVKCWNLSIVSLVQLNLNKKESLKPKSFINVGTHATLLLEGTADDEKVKGFWSLCLKSYFAATTFLQ